MPSFPIREKLICSGIRSANFDFPCYLKESLFSLSDYIHRHLRLSFCHRFFTNWEDYFAFLFLVFSPMDLVGSLIFFCFSGSC